MHILCMSCLVAKEDDRNVRNPLGERSYTLKKISNRVFIMLVFLLGFSFGAADLSGDAEKNGRQKGNVKCWVLDFSTI